MSISSLILFGSRAREDNNLRSDIDILVITFDGHPKQVKIDSVSLSFYPLDVLVEKAKDGDLFVLHIIREGKLLTGSAASLEKIRASFRNKLTYKKEIHAASDLGWMIVRYGAEFDKKLVQKRVTWCVRTVLIAISVQKGDPTFSTDGLRAVDPSPAVARLLQQKDDPISSDTFCLLRSFLTEQGLGDPCPDASNPSDYLGHFECSGNTVALHMLVSKQKRDDLEEYAGR